MRATALTLSFLFTHLDTLIENGEKLNCDDPTYTNGLTAN